jgi:hypothetical protein
MQASCDLASQLLRSTVPDGAAQVMLCMPTYLPYIFFEGSRASEFIQPVSIFLGILLTLLVVMLDVEAQVMWIEGREQHFKELSSGPKASADLVVVEHGGVTIMPDNKL